MSDALEKARDALLRAFPIDRQLYALADFIDAKVNAILDAREAKAEPDPRDARLAELERENEVLDGNYQTAQANWDLTLDRAEKAEAALAELRGRVGKARVVLESIRGQGLTDLADRRIVEAIRALTDPEAKEGGGPDNDGRSDASPSVDRGDIAQPARDTDPVPATDAREAPADYIAKAITEAFGERCPDFDPDCHCCRAWDAYDTLNDMASCALSSDPARAAGITGKGTSDE